MRKSPEGEWGAEEKNFLPVPGLEEGATSKSRGEPEPQPETPTWCPASVMAGSFTTSSQSNHWLLSEERLAELRSGDGANAVPPPLHLVLAVALPDPTL